MLLIFSHTILFSYSYYKRITSLKVGCQSFAKHCCSTIGNKQWLSVDFILTNAFVKLLPLLCYIVVYV